MSILLTPFMSIAVSTVVHPSRLLLGLVICMCVGTAMVGICTGFALVGNGSPFSRAVIAGACMLGACWGLYRYLVGRKSFHIDISGAGQIRLAVHPASTPAPSPGRRISGELVHLKASSTLWPNLLLLRLQTSDNQVKILPILPDCVGADEYRALSVACRWVVTNRHVESHKIL